MRNYRKVSIVLFIVLLLFFLLPSTLSLGQNNQLAVAQEQKNSKSLIAAVTGSIFGAIFGVISSWLTTKFEYTKDLKLLKNQIRAEREEEIQREISRLKLMYLSPLRLAAQELSERLQTIFWEKRNGEPDPSLKHWFTYIKNEAHKDSVNFPNHANGQAHFAATSLYLTAIYFAHSVKIRQKIPFTNFPEYNEQLMKHIEDVRKAWSGEYGMWEEAQDSIGQDLIESGGNILTYREFCHAIMDSNKHPWYLRLMDYYRDFDLRPLEEIQSIKDKLKDLISFLDKTPKIKSLDTTESLLNKLK